MKKTTTSNPLKFFNDAKEARNKSFSKSLPKKGDGGRTMGPMTQQEAEQAAFASSQNNAITSGEGPRVYSNEDKIKQLMQKGMRSGDAYKEYKSIKPNIPPVTTPQPTYSEYMSPGIQMKQKKGGTHKMPNGKVMLNSKMKKGGVVKKKYDEGGEIDPRNKKYNKFKGDPTSTVSKVGDKSIKFDTSNAGKTYTKTTYKKVTANRAQNASPEKRWGDDEIKKTKIISGNAATRQANRLAKKIENQPGTYQKMGGITKTTVVNRIAGAKKNARKKK